MGKIDPMGASGEGRWWHGAQYSSLMICLRIRKEGASENSSSGNILSSFAIRLLCYDSASRQNFHTTFYKMYGVKKIGSSALCRTSQLTPYPHLEPLIWGLWTGWRELLRSSVAVAKSTFKLRNSWRDTASTMTQARVTSKCSNALGDQFSLCGGKGKTPVTNQGVLIILGSVLPCEHHLMLMCVATTRLDRDSQD